MNTSHHSSSSGFSLVEICLAIGVVAFAFVAIFGLLPVGMNVFRDSMNTSVGAQIAQRMLNEAQQTEFSTLVGGTPPEPIHLLYENRYFDDQGNELSDASSSASIYQARAVSQVSPKFPDGAGKNTIVMDELAIVTVQVAFNPGHQEVKVDDSLLWIANKSVPIRNYGVLVAHHD